MQPSTLAKRLWLLLFLATVAFYFYGLGHLPFVGPDEPRYAQVAREMFERGDLVNPTLGGHTWFEKPVLLYWMIMAGFATFGISEWAARLGPAISGLLTAAAVCWVGRRVARAEADRELSGLARWSALITLTFLATIVFSRGVGVDMVFTMTVAWALSFFLGSELEEKEARRRLLLAGFYVFAGVSLLAKGLVGIVVPFGVVVVYYALRRVFPSRHLIISLLWGLPLAVAVSGVWYFPVLARHGWPFVDEFFLQHHFARYLSNKYHHPQPFYFYGPMIVLMSLPWTAFLIDGLLYSREWHWRGDSPQSKLRVFALAWLLLPLGFFSFSVSKLPGYILPVLPAVALLSGERLTRFIAQEQKSFWAMRATGAIFLLFAIGGACFLVRRGEFSLWCTVASAAALMIAGVVCLFWTRMRALSALSAVCATIAALAIVINCGVTSFANRESARELIALAASRGYGSAPVFALHGIDRSAEFYAAGRVVYGADGEPVRFEGAVQVAETARQRGPILVFVPVEYVGQLTELSTVSAEVIGENGQTALVAVRALAS